MKVTEALSLVEEGVGVRPGPTNVLNSRRAVNLLAGGDPITRVAVWNVTRRDTVGGSPPPSKGLDSTSNPMTSSTIVKNTRVHLSHPEAQLFIATLIVDGVIDSSGEGPRSRPGGPSSIDGLSYTDDRGGVRTGATTV